MTSAVMFPFRFHPIFRAAALPFGIRDDTARLEVIDDRLDVVFGPWRVRTPLDNVVGAEVSGPLAWPKVIGPPHLSLTDRGLTFATNPDIGVCIRFARPGAGMDPLGVLRHPGLTVTVRDPATLVELLERAHDRARHADVGQTAKVDELLEQAHDELGALSAGELRQRGRERGLTGVSRLSKAELIALLEPGQPRPGDG